MFRHWAWPGAQPESQLLRISTWHRAEQEKPAATGPGAGAWATGGWLPDPPLPPGPRPDSTFLLLAFLYGNHSCVVTKMQGRGLGTDERWGHGGRRDGLGRDRTSCGVGGREATGQR